MKLPLRIHGPVEIVPMPGQHKVISDIIADYHDLFDAARLLAKECEARRAFDRYSKCMVFPPKCPVEDKAAVHAAGEVVTYHRDECNTNPLCAALLAEVRGNAHPSDPTT